MLSRRNYARLIGAALAVLTIAAFAFLIVVYWVEIRPMYRTLLSKRRLLTTQIDKRAIVDECQALIAQLPDGVSESEWHDLTRKSELPPAIRYLNPSWVAVNKNEVRIECAGGFWHQGLIYLANAEDSPLTIHGTAYTRCNRLSPHLWYYESE